MNADMIQNISSWDNEIFPSMISSGQSNILLKSSPESDETMD